MRVRGDEKAAGAPVAASRKGGSTAEFQSSALHGELVELGKLARELPCEGASVWEEDDFQRRYRGLEIECLGLEWLERRLAGEEPEARTLRSMLSCRLEALQQRLAELTISAFGYYALPYPDPLHIDNEGPLGPRQALPAMRRLAAYFEPAADAGPSQHRDEIARQLFTQR